MFFPPATLRPKARHLGAVLLVSGVVTIQTLAVATPSTPEAGTALSSDLAFKRFPIERYRHIWENSPFSAATEAPTQAQDAEWLLTGISRLGDAPFAILTHKQTRRSVSLAAGESLDQIKLVHAEWAPESSNSFAVFEINGEQKRLQFDEDSLMLLAAQATNAAPRTAVQPAQNNQPNRPNPPAPQAQNPQPKLTFAQRVAGIPPGLPESLRQRAIKKAREETQGGSAPRRRIIRPSN